MYIIITIDTEEDNWGDYEASSWETRNIGKIPYLQDIFDEFNVKPTYFITYPVTTDEKAISILSKILNGGRCEVGTHCHPWNTPPVEEEITSYNTMLCNLPSDLQYRKIETLHKTIIDNLGITPVSFRTGRWGFNEYVAENIIKMGYKVDSSVVSFTDWTHKYGPDYSQISPKPYLFSTDNTTDITGNGTIIEVPATRGYLQGNFLLMNSISNLFRKRYIQKMRLKGLLYKLNLVNKVWLSPEFSSLEEMIKLTRAMQKEKHMFINMTFHSSSLMAGCTPVTRSKSDEKDIFKKIREYLSFTRKTGIKSIKLSNMVNYYNG